MQNFFRVIATMSSYQNVLREIKTVDILLDKMNSLAGADSLNRREAAWVAPMDAWKTRKPYSIFAEMVNSAPQDNEAPEPQGSQMDNDEVEASVLSATAESITTRNTPSSFSSSGSEVDEQYKNKVVIKREKWNYDTKHILTFRKINYLM